MTRNDSVASTHHRQGVLWSEDEPALLLRLETTERGLSSAEASRRASIFGPNACEHRLRFPRATLFIRQLKSPIAILLGVAACISSLVGDAFDGITILVILLASALLSYWQEFRAHSAIERLLKRLQHRIDTLRDGSWQSIPARDLVPGDVIALEAGSQIPADCRVIASRDLSVDESSLTGESFATEKRPGICPTNAPLSARSNSVFTGTHVISGTGTAVIVSTGFKTIFGEITSRLQQSPPETEFQIGVRNFGYLLLEVAATLALVVLAVNIHYERAPLDSLLFTLALVVGMTPQLLPAIVTSTLSQGAHRMADKDMIVRRLHAIADLGGISILCTDKTGTLTEGSMRWESSLAMNGKSSEKAALYGYLNASFETGFSNAIDDAIRAAPPVTSHNYTKLDELPYDFNRRMLSVSVSSEQGALLITKGAFKEVIVRCSYAEGATGERVAIDAIAEQAAKLFQSLSEQGHRCLGIAYKPLLSLQPLSADSEQDLVLLGLLVFSDPPKPSAIESIRALEQHGITCKLVTGDNRYVASKLADDLGVLDRNAILLGQEIDALTESALVVRARDVDIFAEVDPNQKERIIRALKKTGLGVGYIGDGINDAAALYAADVGVSVDTATDVTKEAADVVLLTKDLNVLLDAVREGRAAFANTLKYILISTSANFGNMFSVAGASFFADFLPLLPKQILLLNVLADLPAMAIATDRVDPEMTARPLRWSSKTITAFMLIYGLISSIFDYLTFAALLILRVPAPVFRTSWFIESVLSEVCMLLVIRTRRPLWRSPVGRVLVFAGFLTAIATLYLPYSPIGAAFGFEPLKLQYVALVFLILAPYILLAEIAKRILAGKDKALTVSSNTADTLSRPR
jgi:Mg2+-importing ATPase